jgi:hypothetical protein
VTVVRNWTDIQPPGRYRRSAGRPATASAISVFVVTHDPGTLTWQAV